MAFLQPTGFDSFIEYWRFVWAREFHDVDPPFAKTEYEKTILERVGDVMVRPLVGLGDHALRNIRNPLMVLTITLTAIVAVTILFYPEELVKAVSKVVPFALRIKPWMFRAGVFALVQTTILGVGLRALGRLSPWGELWGLWDQLPRRIRPVSIGTEIVAPAV